MILDERGCSGFEDWADMATPTLSVYGNVPTIISVKEWKRWAFDVCQMGGVAAQNPPSPAPYNDWRQWVQDFNNTVR